MEPLPKIRLTMRVPKGRRHIVDNEKVEVIEDDGAFIVDISHLVSEATVIGKVGSPRKLLLEVMLSDVVVEDVPK